MKRILALLLTVAILFSFASLPTSAASGEISFSISDAAADKGENVIVWVTLNSTEYTQKVCGLSFALAYDSECLEYISGDSADSMLTSPTIYDNKKNSKVVFAWSSDSNVLLPTNKRICGFRFKILDKTEKNETKINFEYKSGYSINTSDNTFNDFVVNGSNVFATITFSSIDSQVVRVEGIIDAIGTVEYSEECLNKILDATREYMLLTENQKAQVKNYQKLLDAQNEYERLKVIAENSEASAQAQKFLEDNQKVLELTVETVALTDKNAVTDAINDYNKLSDDAKYAIHNYYVHLKNLNKKIELLQLAKDEADAAAKEDAEARAEAEKMAKSFRKEYASLLKLTAQDIKLYHEEDLTAAVSAVDNLSAVNIYIKEYLKEEYALLTALLEICKALPKPVEMTESEKMAENFKNTFFYVLDLTEETVSAEDLVEIMVAMGVYDILPADVQSLLEKEYEKLGILYGIAEGLSENQEDDTQSGESTSSEAEKPQEKPGSQDSTSSENTGSEIQPETIIQEVVKTETVEKVKVEVQEKIKEKIKEIVEEKEVIVEVDKNLSAKKEVSVGVRKIGVFSLVLFATFIFSTLNLAALFVFYKFFYRKKLNSLKGGNDEK